MPENQYESALVVLVREADLLVQSLRNKYDPAAADGIPAHITINYPFLPGLEAGEDLLKRLSGLFSSFQAFDFSLNTIGRFPGVIYLKPTPEEPFRNLIHMVADEFPESPPYSGVFDDLIPHLTIALGEFIEDFDVIENEIINELTGILPIESAATGVSLLNNQNRKWEEEDIFKFRNS